MKTYSELEKDFAEILLLGKELTEHNNVSDMMMKFSSSKKAVIFHGNDWDEISIAWDGIVCQFDEPNAESFYEKEVVIKFLEESKDLKEFFNNMLKLKEE